ncbi:MAG: hypothetical protein ACI36Y_03895 [Coriobacteriales bacterium]
MGSESEQGFLRHLVVMLKEIGMEVVVEGLETREARRDGIGPGGGLIPARAEAWKNFLRGICNCPSHFPSVLRED